MENEDNSFHHHEKQQYYQPHFPSMADVIEHLKMCKEILGFILGAVIIDPLKEVVKDIVKRFVEKKIESKDEAPRPLLYDANGAVVKTVKNKK
jgi:DNA-binding MltR family transcriptional regulator